MSRMNTQERTIFLNNLDRMLSLLNCTYKNINIKYAYFPIPRTTSFIIQHYHHQIKYNSYSCYL